jgi:PIN domain
LSTGAAPVAVLDACVLYPAPVRDLLLRLALAGLYRARWSAAILDECFRNIIRDRPDLSPAALRRTRSLMEASVRDANITGYEHRINEVELPDADDRHVVAAAFHGDASVIITFNLRDFPQRALRRFNLVAVHPDEFVSMLLDIDGDAVLQVLDDQAAALRNPPLSDEELLDVLDRAGLSSAVQRLRVGAPPSAARQVRRLCTTCGEPVELDDLNDPESWIHAPDANDAADHGATVD